MVADGEHPAQHSELTFWLLDTRDIWRGERIADAARNALSQVSASERDRAKRFHFIADARLNLGSSLLKRLYVSRSFGVRWQDISFSRRGDERHGKPAYLPASSLAGGKVDEQARQVDFNVSHQAGLVSLVGCVYSSESPASEFSDSQDGDAGNGDARDGKPKDGSTRDGRTEVQVGTDIVCIDERGRDRTHIARDGVEGWIRMHEDVFSSADVDAMLAPVHESIPPLLSTAIPIPTTIPTTHPIDTTKSTTDTTSAAVKSNPTNPKTSIPYRRDPAEEQILAIKMRRFYAYWALKEAYVKLTGEALLAPWLKEVEFRNVRVPNPAPSPTTSTIPAASASPSSSAGNASSIAGTTISQWGELVQGIKVYRAGILLDDVEMSLQAFETRYMIATAIKGRKTLDMKDLQELEELKDSRDLRDSSESRELKDAKALPNPEEWEPKYTLLDLERDILAHAQNMNDYM